MKEEYRKAVVDMAKGLAALRVEVDGSIVDELEERFSKVMELLNQTSDEPLSNTEAMRWVKTSERLPQYDDYYFVLNTGLSDKGVAMFNPYNQKWYELNTEVHPTEWLEESAAVKDDWKERFRKWRDEFYIRNQRERPTFKDYQDWIETNLL